MCIRDRVAHFSEARIDRAREDGETCGYDLASVADMVVLDDDTVAVALGGDGDDLGACYSACVVGVLSLASGRLVTQQVDDESGCAGLIKAPDGALLLDCGGALRVLRRVVTR